MVVHATADADGEYEAVTVAPSTRKATPKAVTTSTNDQVNRRWAWDEPSRIISGATGAYTQYDAATNKWAPGPAPAHSGRVLITVGTKPVEWVGPGTTKPGALYIGDTRLDLKLNKAPRQGDTGSEPTDIVTPLAATNSWALLVIRTENSGNGADTPDSKLVVARPGQSKVKAVPFDANHEFGGAGSDGDNLETLGSLVHSPTGTAVVTDGQHCITVNRSGQVAISADGSELEPRSFDGKTAYFTTTGMDGTPAAVSCTVGDSDSMKPAEEPAVPPVLLTPKGALFHSQPSEDEASDEMVFIPN